MLEVESGSRLIRVCSPFFGAEGRAGMGTCGAEGRAGPGDVWGRHGAARSGDFAKGAGGGCGAGRGGDNAHPCAVSPKMAIRGHFTLGDRLLPK